MPDKTIYLCTSCNHTLDEHDDGDERACMHAEDNKLCKCHTYQGGELPVDAVEFDPVKIPSHYNSGAIEVANFITDQKLNYPLGNVVKYVSRAGKKDVDKELQDLEKAAAYLQMAHNLASGLPAVVRHPITNEVVWSLFKN